MNQDIINAKIENIRHCLQRIRAKTPADVETLLEDYDLQDIISINLERAIQSCVDTGAHVIASLEVSVPGTMSETFGKLVSSNVIDADLADRLSRAVGFRNISVHEYQSIDWNIVFSIITKHIKDFEDFMRQVSKWQARGER